MSRLTSEAGRAFAAALILLPALSLTLVWAGVVFAGLFHITAAARQRPAVDELMTALLLLCVVCSATGVMLFSATRYRRWTRR